MVTMDDMKDALGTTADMTVFRKLRGLDYLTSYSHRGQYYVLRSAAQFDERGLWSHRNVHFSQFGSLLDTAAEIVSRSEKGYFSPELAKELLVPVKDALRLLVERNRLVREALGRLHLYLSSDPATRRQQRLAREAALAMASAAEAASDEPGVEGHEARAAILLFYSLLDEQQRRLFAGLESLRVGRGGDRRIAELLGLDVHTVGRGRKDLANWDLQLDRIRRPGAGRPPLEKKRPK
jgi:hypothetical protein